MFVDEFDNFIGQRGDFDGSGGVERRFLQKILQEMSDTQWRGKILWIGATNRPDLIDANIKRPGRFSFRIPFLPPSLEERAKIFQAMMNKNSSIKTNIKDWSKAAIKTERYTGADIESIVLEVAWKHVNVSGRKVLTMNDILWAIDEFILQHGDRKKIDHMTLVAIKECSLKSMLPVGWEEIVKEIFEYHDIDIDESKPLTSLIHEPMGSLN